MRQRSGLEEAANQRCPGALLPLPSFADYEKRGKVQIEVVRTSGYSYGSGADCNERCVVWGCDTAR